LNRAIIRVPVIAAQIRSAFLNLKKRKKEKWGAENLSVLKVSRQCPLVLLVGVRLGRVKS
jgi:hypothetical protein